MYMFDNKTDIWFGLEIQQRNERSGRKKEERKNSIRLVSSGIYKCKCKTFFFLQKLHKSGGLVG